MITNNQVWTLGQVVDDWACNLKDGQGAGIENVVEYKGKEYLVVTSFDGVVESPNKQAIER